MKPKRPSKKSIDDSCPHILLWGLILEKGAEKGVTEKHGKRGQIPLISFYE
jgi:hypothetical protein